MSARRIDPQQVYREVDFSNALLVCAYDDRQKCEKYELPNSLSLNELQAQDATLTKDRKIVFYCA